MSVPRFARFAKFFSGSAAPASKQRSPTIWTLYRKTPPVQASKMNLRHHLAPAMEIERKAEELDVGKHSPIEVVLV